MGGLSFAFTGQQVTLDALADSNVIGVAMMSTRALKNKFSHRRQGYTRRRTDPMDLRKTLLVATSGVAS